ncbi:MAG: hypothetical protein ACE5DQ_01785 [Candidatus Paceibacterota bacterium]
MRISVKKNAALASQYDVYLNGHYVKYAIAADDEEGWVSVLVPAHKGGLGGSSFVLTKEGKPLSVIVEGVVDLVKREVSIKEVKIDEPSRESLKSEAMPGWHTWLRNRPGRMAHLVTQPPR